MLVTKKRFEKVTDECLIALHQHAVELERLAKVPKKDEQAALLVNIRLGLLDKVHTELHNSVSQVTNTVRDLTAEVTRIKHTASDFSAWKEMAETLVRHNAALEDRIIALEIGSAPKSKKAVTRKKTK